MSYPFTIFGKYNSGSKEQENTTQHSSYSNNSSQSSLDNKVNRIAKSIANTVIRSAHEDDEEYERKEYTINLPPIPKEVILFAAVIISKVLLYSAYRACNEHGVEILDL